MRRIVSGVSLVQQAGGRGCPLSDRTHFLWDSRDGATNVCLPSLSALHEVLAAAFSDGDAIMRPPIVTVLKTGELKYQRSLCFDFDYKVADGDRVDVVNYAGFAAELWSIIKRHAVNRADLPYSADVVIIGARTVHKPISLHVFFPGWAMNSRGPQSLEDELNEYLREFHLTADMKISGLKLPFSDKPLNGGWRGDCMTLLYATQPRQASGAAFFEAADSLCEGRPVIEWQQRQQHHQQGPAFDGPTTTTLPANRPEAATAWRYYQLFYCPEARIGSVRTLDNAVSISTVERNNVLCPHNGNNHIVRVSTGGKITIKCHGTTNSKRYELTLAQAQALLATLVNGNDSDEQEERPNGDFIRSLVAFLRSGAEISVNTPITEADFIRQGMRMPPHAIPTEYLGRGFLISPKLFNAIETHPGATADDLVRLINLAVGFVSSTGLFIVRYSDGHVSAGQSSKTVQTLMNAFPYVKPGAKKESSFYTTWSSSPLQSRATYLRVTMEEGEETFDAFHLVIRPTINVAIATHELARYTDEQRDQYYVAASEFWHILMTTLTCASREDYQIFYKWLRLWVAETILGKQLIGLYAQLYDPNGGIGKSRLSSIIMSMIGRKNCAIVKNIGQFVNDRWQTGRIGTRYISIDDAKMSSTHESAFNVMITGHEFAVEYKGGTQNNTVSNYASVAVMTNESELAATTQKDRRVAFIMGREAYNTDSPLFTMSAYALFGDTHDKMLAWCYRNLELRPGSPPTPFLYSLALVMQRDRDEFDGDSTRIIEWLRLRVQNGDLRSEEKDLIAERQFGPVGSWLTTELCQEGGRLFHLSQIWHANAAQELYINEDWPLDAGTVVDGVTDELGHYLVIPTATLYAAFRVYMAANQINANLDIRTFGTQFKSAFNGLSVLWSDEARSFVTATSARHTLARAQNNFGHWSYNATAAGPVTRKCYALDYSAFNAKIPVAEN